MAEPRMDDTRQRRYAWDRLAGESQTVYALFETYRMMGRVRTVAKVADEAGKTRDYCWKLSRTHQWARRVEAWDHEQDRLFSEKLTDRRLQLAEHTLGMLAVARNKLAQRLQTIDPEDLSPTQWLQWMDTIVRLERETVGLPSQTVGMTGSQGGPIEQEIRGLTDEERERLLTRLANEALRRVGKPSTATMKDTNDGVTGGD